MVAGLICLTCFEMALAKKMALNKKRKEVKRLLFFNSLSLFYVYQSSVLTIIVQMRQKRDKLELMKDVFLKKKKKQHTDQIFPSNKTYRDASFCHVMLNR